MRRMPGTLWSLIAMCVLLACACVALSARVQSLQKSVAEWRMLAESSRTDALEPGMPFPELTLSGSDGATASLRSLATLGGCIVMISSRRCQYCEQVKADWALVQNEATLRDIGVVRIVLDAEAESLAPDELTPVQASQAALSNSLLGVPAAFVLDQEGVIAARWYGVEMSGLMETVRSVP